MYFYALNLLKLKRLPNLNVLRFLLASLVMLFHIPQLSRNQGLPYFLDTSVLNRGVEAVYMFFVLSGFLIIRIIYKEKQKRSFSIKKFYIRRMLRIFPLYYLIAAFGFLFYWYIVPKLGIPFENNYKLFDGVALTTFFLPNVFCKLYRPGGILEVLWSIGIEEQFYIIIAPLIFWINRGRVLLALIVLTIIYFTAFHLEVFTVLKQYDMVFFFLFFGGIIAILEEKKQLEFLKRTKLTPLVIVITTILYFTTPILDFNNKLLFNGLTMVLFGLFIHTIAYNNFGVTIQNRLLNYLGEISYGIYMFHVIALNCVVFVFLKIDKLDIFNNWLTIILINILTFAITIVMAYLSYNYFETYFLKLKNKFRA